jgi:hypothetical protein
MQTNDKDMEQSKPKFVEVDALKERRIEEISNIQTKLSNTVHSVVCCTAVPRQSGNFQRKRVQFVHVLSHTKKSFIFKIVL